MFKMAVKLILNVGGEFELWVLKYTLLLLEEIQTEKGSWKMFKNVNSL